MKITKLHNDEIDITIPLVKTLLKSQFPHWAHFDLQLILPEGTDNVMYKLGNDLVVRIPRTESSSQNIAKECEWLPKLAPQLSLPIPSPTGIGKASAHFPYPWLICDYLEGINLNTESSENFLNDELAARDLGHFVLSMQNIDASNVPIWNRGMPLKMRDEVTKKCIPQMSEWYDVNLLAQLWEKSLEAPAWNGTNKLTHGDLHAGNLLVKDGRISAVVDFGLLGAGDPAVDLMVAWAVLSKETRGIFRSIVKPDEATWLRAKGWALTMGIVAYPYYKDTNPALAKAAKRALDEVLLDEKIK